MFDVNMRLTPNIRLNRLLDYSIVSLSPRQMSGGADRDRTGGLLVANQALSQLSYSPNFSYRLSAVSSEPNRFGLAQGQKRI